MVAKTVRKNARSTKLILLLTLVVAMILGVGHASPSHAADLLFAGDFECGDLTGFHWYQNEPEVVTAPHPVRAGTYSMRSYLHRYESEYSYRTEVHVGSHNTLNFNIGEEYWIGLSIYIPDDWVFDIDGLDDVVFQIQAEPDPGEDYRSPVFALDINHDDWRIYRRWDSRRYAPSGNTFEGTQRYDFPLGSSIGKWTDWVIHVKWSYQSDGFLEVWRDGERIINQAGPNCSNDERGPYPQMGMYKWSWRGDYPSNTDWRLIYHDELRIADASASYEDVVPGGSPPPVSPTPTPIPSPTPPPSREITVDNKHSGFSTVGAGAWSASSGANPYMGESLWNDRFADIGDQAIWRFAPEESGNFEVYAWWTEYDSRVTDAPYTVNYEGGSEVIKVNQQENGGRWNLLGTFPFSAGREYSVVLSDEATQGGDSICADAVRLVYRSGGPTGQTQIFLPFVSRSSLP